MKEEAHPETEASNPKDMIADLLATPSTPANRYILLGQDEYHEHSSSISALKVLCRIISHVPYREFLTMMILKLL